LIGLFGGTFDPVHRGHVHAAVAVCDELGLDRLRLILSARPGHRDAPGTAVAHRWAMLSLAAEVDVRLQPDDRECRRNGPSYTIDTLTELRAEQPSSGLCWVLGWDQFRLLEEWHRWQALLELCNLVVLPRPAAASSTAVALAPRWWASAVDELSPTLQALTAACRVDGLRQQRQGAIYFLRSQMLALSATQIREHIAAGRPVEHLLPPGVYTYIKKHGLYGVTSDP